MVVKRRGRTKTIKIQKIKQIKMNLLTKNKNLAILVSFATRIILPKNAHIEQSFQNSLKVLKHLLS